MTAENNTNEESLDERLDPRSLNVQGSVDDSTVVVGDRNTIQHINVFSPITVGPATATPSQPLSKREYRWRQTLVSKVKHYWIEGVLKKSLNNQALIELGLEERSKAVVSPLRGIGEFPDELDRTFPEGTQTAAIFDGLGAGRTLLVLGEPGSGKTTTLLKLVQSLLERIGDDLSQPIPIILNLSSWVKKRQPIADWLVQDLYETFQVSKALGTTWIDDEQLVLCLDGLDEVAERHRNTCVEALNQFIQDHGRTEMVVCSRIKDYEALSERLKLRSAIYVQPLTPQQVDQYLNQVGEPLTALRTALNQNTEIKAFATSPLILSVMSLVYQGCSLDEFYQLSDADNFRQQLFGAYVKRMFQRRDSTTYQYSKEQTIHWLIWMAQRMVQTSQTVFLIERMQPSWLPAGAQQLWYRLESSLIVGLAYWLTYWLIGVLTFEQIAGLIGGSIGGPRIDLIGVLIVGLITAIQGDIQPVETRKWSLKAAKKSILTGCIFGLVGGLSSGLIVGLSNGSIMGLRYGLSSGLSNGLIVGSVVGLSAVLIGGLKGPGMQQRTKPNQGIRKSARNALIVGLTVGFTVGLSAVLVFGFTVGRIAVLVFGMVRGLSSSLSNGLIVGLIVGLMSSLISGGSACIRHLSLRLMLYRIGEVPWNYARFLDYAAERLFLQKVGGGYIFIHRMLLEHFAQMPLEKKHSK